METHEAGFPPSPHSLEIPSGFPLLEWSAASSAKRAILIVRRFTMEISTIGIDQSMRE
jgi:hypothetical protein